MSRWFRFYDEVLNDPKVQRLPPHLFRTWVNMLCLASSNGGILPSIDDIAFRLRISSCDAQQQLSDLILAGLIDIRHDGQHEPHNWPVRQFISDNSTERVRKHRREKKKQKCNGDETFHETSPEQNRTDSETDSEPEQTRETREVKAKPKSFWGGVDGMVSIEARRHVATALGIANADPLVAKFENWSGSRSANDIDAMFKASAAKFYQDAKPAEKAACQPLVGAVPDIVAPIVAASPALRAKLRK